jgi:hypothetical protein
VLFFVCGKTAVVEVFPQEHTTHFLHEALWGKEFPLPAYSPSTQPNKIINSFLHCFGMSRFETEEHSHNFGPIALLTFGESWHNNHHAFPGSASFGLEWYRLDPGYWFIKLLEVLHLAWDVKVPSTEKIQLRLLNR